MKWEYFPETDQIVLDGQDNIVLSREFPLFHIKGNDFRSNGGKDLFTNFNFWYANPSGLTAKIKLIWALTKYVLWGKK